MSYVQALLKDNQNHQKVNLKWQIAPKMMF